MSSHGGKEQHLRLFGVMGSPGRGRRQEIPGVFKGQGQPGPGGEEIGSKSQIYDNHYLHWQQGHLK